MIISHPPKQELRSELPEIKGSNSELNSGGLNNHLPSLPEMSLSGPTELKAVFLGFLRSELYLLVNKYGSKAVNFGEKFKEKKLAIEEVRTLPKKNLELNNQCIFVWLLFNYFYNVDIHNM